MITMKRGDFGLRSLDYSGRWPQPRLLLDFHADTATYSVEGPVVVPANQVLDYVRTNPGMSRYALVAGLGIRKATAYSLVNELVAQGRIRDEYGKLHEVMPS